MRSKDVKVLDCTLRDGGYANDWNFGKKNIKKTIKQLKEANIDIIECGFLSNKRIYDSERSVFDTIDRFREVIPKNRGNSKYVCMINFGDYEIENIPDFDGSSVDGIRVAFHKKDVKRAIKFCRELSRKGYMLFVQDMVTVSYSDIEFLEMIKDFNEIKPYAFYIVDSFGVMQQRDLIRIFYLIDNNLQKNISIGYHSHNNLQLAYSNAQKFIEINSNRSIIVDSSVFGVGRAAGNLNTELIIRYLNDTLGFKYESYPLLQIIDEVLNKIYLKKYWGYSLPHYLSAINDCHPNYATYLSEKNTLTIKAISDILSKIKEEKRRNFNKNYIEGLYIDYQKNDIDDEGSLQKLKKIFKKRNVLLIAPGLSLKKYFNKIKKVIKEEDCIVVSVNFFAQEFDADFLFISNKKRFDQLKSQNIELKKIITSNIKIENLNDYQINYIKLLNDLVCVRDNASLMFLRLANKLGVRKVYLAGLDGYSSDGNNYYNKKMNFLRNKENIEKVNDGMIKVLQKLNQEIGLSFITPTKYNFLNNS